MRSRPEISLRLPPVVHAGETLHVDVTLESASETPIDFVDAVLGFFEEIQLPSGHEAMERRKLLHLAERLEGEGKLGAGRHRYRASFDLPEDLPPTHVGSMIELRCVVEVYVSIPWWPDARETQEVKVRPALRPPRVGAGRWRSVWARAGRRAGLEIDEEALVLAGLLAGCAVEVQPGRGQGDEPGIIARVRFPAAWGLDLELRNRTLIEQGLTLGKDGFALRYRARGREEAQVQAALGSGMQEALLAFDEARVNDAKAWVFCGGGAQDEERLRSFLDRVETLAEAIARATEALPPPSAMAEHLPVWRRFALEVGGALEVGRMRLAGSVEGVAFVLETRFAGAAPASTRIAITAEPPIEESAAGDADALALRPEARGLAAAIREQAARLGEVRRGPDATPEGVALEVGAPLADPAAARGVLGAMLALASALRRDRRGGPYR